MLLRRNRSITSAAVSNASSVPEVEQSDQVVDVTLRVMDTDANNSFASPIESRVAIGVLKDR